METGGSGPESGAAGKILSGGRSCLGRQAAEAGAEMAGSCRGGPGRFRDSAARGGPGPGSWTRCGCSCLRMPGRPQSCSGEGTPHRQADLPPLRRRVQGAGRRGVFRAGCRAGQRRMGPRRDALAAERPAACARPRRSAAMDRGSGSGRTVARGLAARRSAGASRLLRGLERANVQSVPVGRPRPEMQGMPAAGAGDGSAAERAGPGAGPGPRRWSQLLSSASIEPISASSRA